MTRAEMIASLAYACADAAVATVSIGLTREQHLAGDLLWTDERLTEAGFEPLLLQADIDAWIAAYDAAVEALDHDERDDPRP